MSDRIGVFLDVVKNIARIEETRAAAVREAFSLLGEHAPELADILLLQLGDRRRAASWMCVSLRALDGRTAYETLAEGDVDALWDLLFGVEG
jgi:hypothetical protein